MLSSGDCFFVLFGIVLRAWEIKGGILYRVVVAAGAQQVTSSLTPATSIIAEIDLYKFDPWELPSNFFPTLFFSSWIYLLLLKKDISEAISKFIIFN